MAKRHYLEMELRKRIEQAINAVSAEKGSNTPDFILANYLIDCLKAFDSAVSERERWYGRGLDSARPVITPDIPQQDQSKR